MHLWLLATARAVTPLAVEPLAWAAHPAMPAGATDQLTEGLATSGLQIDPEAPLQLASRVVEEKWLYDLGLVQVEMTVDVALSDGDRVLFTVTTRGASTHPIDRRGPARTAQRADALHTLPEGPDMRAEALRAVGASIGSRPALQQILLEPGPVSPMAWVDVDDPVQFGMAPRILRVPLLRSAKRKRSAGMAIATAGLVIGTSAVGTYITAKHASPRGLMALRTTEMVGWGMAAGGGLLWYNGDRQVDAW